MKRVLLISICLYTLNSIGQTQLEITQTAMNEYSKSLKIKDSIVLEIKKHHQNDTQFLLSFEKTEETWENFVNEQFQVEFPSFENWENRHIIYGSSFDMCYYFFLKEYIDIRISILENIIKPEGDICGG